MTPEERKEYVKYRIEKAYQTYEAAKVLSDNGFWNSAVNRLYYSLFFAANALLVLKGIEAKRHATLKSQFSQHFVKTGKFEKKYGRLLSELYDWRQKADYEVVFDYDENSVLPLFQPVKEMLDQINQEIKNVL
ncbi:MAG: HEPN domain-containing protein [Bacteroidales bacterium]|nr:HEPN domain-containing protein [Bacteroidales bacterium]